MKTKIFSILMILLLTMSLFPQIASAEDKETWTITVDANGGVFADGTKSFSFTLPKGKNAVEAEAEYTIDQLTVPTIPDNDDLAFIGFSLKNDEWVDVDWWTVYASDEDTTLYAVYRPGGSFWWQNDLNEDGSLYYYMNNSGIMSVMGEGEVNDLYDHPFAKTTVKTLYIEGNVYGIGTKALEQLDSLETLYLGRNVSTLERYALTYCDLLKEIIVAEDNPYLKTVNGVLYSKDGKILYRLPHNGTESLSVPDGVEEIGIDAIGDVLALKNAMLPASVKTINQEAFDGCKNLESISFSKSVSTIGRNAFNHCDNLRDVYFDGSINDWNRISIEENETLLKANIHFSDNSPEIHELEKTSYLAPTCIKEGHSEYYTCTICGKYFSDEEGTNEIEKDSWALPATGHTAGNLVKENIINATERSEGGYDEVTYCSGCGIELNRVSKKIPVIEQPETDEPAPISNEPETSEEAETPATPDEPKTPEEAETPATPAELETPEEAETPATPDEPKTPEEAETPAIPTVPEATEEPESPTMPIGENTPAADPNDLFTDVSLNTVNTTSYKSIYWAVDNGIVRGYSDGTFKPEVICTREQFTIMLWRFAGEPASDASAVNKFTDVSDFSNNTSKKAVAWAVEQGVIKGFSDGSFQPKEDITRAQVAVMLWRFAGEVSVSTTSSKFSDISSYSSSVQNAIIWEESSGVASGYKDGTFKPDDGCQRQHMAIFLYRFNSKVEQYKPLD